MIDKERNYPCGDILNYSYDECIKKGLIGVYKCKFN